MDLKIKKSGVYVAAVGASAGGVEALQQLFSHLPPDLTPISFVIAQHLSPNLQSRLAETLMNHTGLKVVEIRNTISIKQGIIYITPPDREVSVRKGKLLLSRPPRTHAARPSIDNLFISLAKDQQSRAIGIVLSGTGSDGAIGVQAIKENGGTCIVQEPSSAKYDGMPIAALETGKVDYSILPEKMGICLQEITAGKGEGSPDNRISNNKGLNRNSIEGIIELLAMRTGTDFSNYKPNTLHRRVERRMAQLKMVSPAKYHDYIEKLPEELDELFYQVLIGVTGFFRDPDVFKDLKKYLLAMLKSKSELDTIRIWIAGCATGEEAYSVAITMAKLLKEQGLSNPVQIIATDINEHSLNTARKGIYSKKTLQKIPADILREYFIPHNGDFEINKSIRAMVLFSRHDLSSNPPFLKLDLIVCRNLLIYLNEKLQNHIFPVFHSALHPNGYLLLGKSESVGQFSNLFSILSRTGKIYQRKTSPSIPKVRYTPFKINEKFTPPAKLKKTVSEMAKETIFRSFEWPYVVVNDNMEIQEIHGDVSKFLGLRPGQMNANLIKLAHKDLKIELRSILNKCIEHKKELVSPLKKIEVAGQPHFVKIKVQHLDFSEPPDDFFLIIFEEGKPDKVKYEGKKFIPSGKYDALRIAELERELETMKESLQTFVERLENTNTEQQSLNEELQSVNEELKISNEELETANEELQSSNEEINIAYSELKAANESLELKEAALRKSNANTSALLNNTTQAFVLLDADRRILAFNRVAQDTFRKLFGWKLEVNGNFSLFISEEKSVYFGEEIGLALKGKTVIKEKEIYIPGKRSVTFILNCTPVKGVDQKLQALSLSLLDISALTQARNELQKTQELINSVFHTTDIGIAVLDEKGRYIKANDGYEKLLGYGKGELEGKLFQFSELAINKKGSAAKLAEWFGGEEVSEEGNGVRRNGEIFPLFRTIKRIQNRDGSNYLVVTIRDITETKRYRTLLQDTEKFARIGGWSYDLATKKITRTDEIYHILEIDESGVGNLTPIKRMDTFFEDKSLPLVKKAWNSAIRQGRPFDLRTGLTTGTGKRKWVRFTGIPEIINQKIIRINGTLHDITHQKEAELELERLSLVASKTNNAVFITDGFGKTIWINESVERMTGFNGTDLMGKTPGSILQGRDTDKSVVTRISKRLKKRLPASEIILNYKKDGSPFWIKMDIAPVFKDEKLQNFIGIGVDVTELIRAREAEKMKMALEQEQKLFNAIAGNFPDGIIGVLDKKLHYIFVGGAEIEKLGLNREEFIGNRIFDHLSAKSNSLAVPFLNRAAKGGKEVSFEAEMLGRTFAVNAVPLKGEDATDNKILVVLYNITQRKRAEEELKEALAKQKELNELKSKFVSIASHEFRTPLTAILSSTFLISKYSQLQKEEKTQKHVERIEMAVGTLTDILNDFLSLGRIEDGKLPNNIVEFDVIDFCNSIIDEIQPTLKKGQHVIYRNEGKNNIFSLDKQHLKIVLINLLSNAAKYSPENGSIWLNSSYLNGQMQFHVKDKGIGIPLADQPRLFQTFFRANNATHIQGTGMGLHIIKRFLDIMGGHIHFTSRENQGSTFSIVFPEPVMNPTKS